MKILLINDYGVPAGGAECIVLSLRDELRRRGHDARLFASTAAVAGLPNLANATCHGTSGPLRTPSSAPTPGPSGPCDGSLPTSAPTLSTSTSTSRNSRR